MSEKVEMRAAYEWTCPNCGRDNFERAVVAEFSQEERAEMVADHGIEEFDTGDFVSRPDEVTCQHCDSEFETEDFNGPSWGPDKRP